MLWSGIGTSAKREPPNPSILTLNTKTGGTDYGLTYRDSGGSNPEPSTLTATVPSVDKNW